MSQRTVELPENVTSQDAGVERNMPKTLTQGHEDASADLNDPQNQEADAPEQRRRGNTGPTNIQTQDESPSPEPGSETTTIDDIPNPEFHPDRISGTVYNADTNMDEVVQHSRMKVRVGEAADDVNEMTHVLQDVCRTGSGLHHSVAMTHQRSDSIGGIFEDSVLSTDSEIGGILEVAFHCTDPESGDVLKDNIESKTGIIVEDTVQTSTSEIGGVLEDTVQTTVSEIDIIADDNVQSIDLEFGGIFLHSDQNIEAKIGTIVEETVQSGASEIRGVLEDTVRSDNSESGGILKDDVQIMEDRGTLESEIGVLEDQSTLESEIGVLEDQSTLESEIGVLKDQIINSEHGRTVDDASSRLQQPFSLYSSELTNNNNNNNILEADDNNVMSDISTDSAANSVKNDVTLTSESPTVKVKTDMESASCVLEELVPDMAEDQTTENNSEVRLLISSFPHTPILMPSHAEEGSQTVHSDVPQMFYTCDELWVDALDEWQDPPTSYPSLVSSDCSGTSKTGSNSLELPTIERWSSSESWASALSDWIQSTSVLPEDSPTLRNPESQHQFSKDMTSEKTASLESSLEVGDGVSEGQTMIKNSNNRLSDLLFLQNESTNTTQDLSEDGKGETWEGLQEGAEDPQKVCTEGNLEIKCPCASKVREVSDEGAFEENPGAFSCLRSEVRPLKSCEAAHVRDGGSCVFLTAGEDFIMPLTPITIGTSFLDSKEDPGASRTSIKSSLAGIDEEIRSDLTRRTGKSTSESPDNRFFRDVSKDQDSSSCEDTKYGTEDSDVSSELQRVISPTGERFMICEEKHVAYLTLDVDDILSLKHLPEDWSALNPVSCVARERVAKMPHKTKTRSNKHKDKSANNQQIAAQTKKRENVRAESHVQGSGGGEEAPATTIESVVLTEKVTSRPQGSKKKKKHGAPKVESEPRLEAENRTTAKNAKSKNETPPTPPSKAREKPVKHEGKETSANETASEEKTKTGTETSSARPSGAADDDIIKRRRISGDKPGSVSVRTRPQLPAIFQQKKQEDVVQAKVQASKEVPRVLSEIEAAPVVDDPQSITLWCRFSSIKIDSSIMWVKEGATLHEEKKKAGDDGRVSLCLLKACSKDLGFYRCTLSNTRGSVSTSDYHLTSEVLMELVIPDHDTPAERKATDGDEEDVSCAPLLFKDDILSDQYFGEKQHTSIMTEKAHFGEGMHRKAFRTMMRAGTTPLFGLGHACVLKVHSSIGYGTQNHEEVVQKNYNLAVEECYVQNTAREYIKAYTDVAKSAGSFGEVPEIIPIFLVHRPANAVPYATLEEELIGDFVKYSVRDGKEINLMRRDSEAGQKCCAFQHWVYTQTDGNLLVTDMQGVGMKLTDVGIATCKKGYKGFYGNCSTSFIDQFKALHLCNRFCELLGLTSLQPKPKPQPAARKKTLGAAVKGKS